MGEMTRPGRSPSLFSRRRLMALPGAFLFLSTPFLSTPTQAGEPDPDRYIERGTIRLTVDGKAKTLHVLANRETGRGGIYPGRDGNGRPLLFITGAAVDAKGARQRYPNATLVLFAAADGSGTLVSAKLYPGAEDDTLYADAVKKVGQLHLAAFKKSADGELTGTASGVMLDYRSGDGEVMIPVEDGKSHRFDMRFAIRLP